MILDRFYCRVILIVFFVSFEFKENLIQKIKINESYGKWVIIKICRFLKYVKYEKIIGEKIILIVKNIFNK